MDGRRMISDIHGAYSQSQIGITRYLITSSEDWIRHEIAGGARLDGKVRIYMHGRVNDSLADS